MSALPGTSITRSVPTREDIIGICAMAVRPQSVWRNRDSADAQKQVGEAWALLRAGCDFRVVYDDRYTSTDERTIWVEIAYQGFRYYEMGSGHKDHEMFYLPTPARLDSAGEGDWY